MGRDNKTKKYVERRDNDFAMSDLERVGFFRELGYVSINDPYFTSNTFVGRGNKPFKGREIMGLGTKVKDGTQAGYFHQTFVRLCEGEGYSDPVSLIRQFRNKRIRKRLAGPFKPPDGPKSQCGLGSFCNTINKGPTAMSRDLKSPVEEETPVSKPNLIVNPPKKGSGYGYMNITIGEYPEWKACSYDSFKEKYERLLEKENKRVLGGPFFSATKSDQLFDLNPYIDKEPGKVKPRKSPPKPAKTKKVRHTGPFLPASPPKKDGGMKAGTITPFPEYRGDPYLLVYKYPKDERNKDGKIYNTGLTSHYTRQNSLLYQNTDRRTNPMTHKCLPEVTEYKCPTSRDIGHRIRAF